MRFVLLVAFLVGTAFFAALPIYAPPVVLQADEMPCFLMGLVAAVVAGATLGLVASASPRPPSTSKRSGAGVRRGGA